MTLMDGVGPGKQHASNVQGNKGEGMNSTREGVTATHQPIHQGIRL
jgi:hypothetical protein